MNLEHEAVRITEELGDVVFVGALAVNHYTRSRGTMDVDLVVAGPLDEKLLKALGYRKREASRSSWYTPRGIQADFYTKDVGRIDVNWIVETSVPVKLGKKGIRVICLEGLVLAKHRAGRSQDVADLQQLIADRGKDIRWGTLGEVATELEVKELKQIAKGLG